MADPKPARIQFSLAGLLGAVLTGCLIFGALANASSMCEFSASCTALPEDDEKLVAPPSAIRQWWSACNAIVLARPGGAWAATWGDDPEDPDYITFARIREFDPPRVMMLTDFQYQARTGALPFDADLTTRFDVRLAQGGAVLRVEQDGFPEDPVADEFFAACKAGWQQTLAGIQRYLEDDASRSS